MYLSHHGGGCCGVMELWGFPFDPAHMAFPIADYNTRTAYGTDPLIHQRLVAPINYEGAPVETGKERLYRYLEIVKNMQSDGLLQFFLQSNCSEAGYEDEDDNWIDEDDSAQSAWIPVLEQAGFTQLHSFLNSNTGNTIYLYTLTYGGEGVRLNEEYLADLKKKWNL